MIKIKLTKVFPTKHGLCPVGYETKAYLCGDRISINVDGIDYWLFFKDEQFKEI